MYDIFLEWGGDLAVGNGGDLAIASNSDAVNQRIFRRLLTNPGDYVWNLDYGGGLGQFVGRPTNPSIIEAIVRTQLALESAVPMTPAPLVVASLVNDANGYVVLTITYTDPFTMAPVQLNISTN